MLRKRPGRSDLFLRELFVNVAKELSRAAEEAKLVVRQANVPGDLLLNEANGGYRRVRP